MVKALEMQHPVHDQMRIVRVERAVGLAHDHRRAQHDVAVQRPLAFIDEREHVGGIVATAIFAIEASPFVLPDDAHGDRCIVGKRSPRPTLERARLRNRGCAGRVLHLHVQARRACAQLDSLRASYAFTMRATKGWRTTSSLVKRVKAIPRTSFNTSCASTSPLFCPRARSICVTSPVITAFVPKPMRVRNIFICSGVVFCASSRMMNE